MNLVAAETGAVRDGAAALAAGPPDVVVDAMARLPQLHLPSRHPLVAATDIDPRYLHKILLCTYERAPADFESLLAIEGVGAKTLRALALASELIHGTPLSLRDPARFSFAHGGKDGTPFPVDRETYDRTIDVLRVAINKAGVDRSEKVDAFKRLARLTAPSPVTEP